MDPSKPTQDADKSPAAPTDHDTSQAHEHGDAKQAQPEQSQPTRQIGEGSYEGSREYGESMKAYLETADVKADAEASQPASPEEAEQLKKAEQEGLAHSKAPGQ
jgi:hypothetical protein